MPSSAIERFHLAVLAMTAPLVERHRDHLACTKGCSDCCVDGLSVFRVEADRIRQRYGSFLETEEPHPPGRCAFLDANGACRIYEDRPYVCRTQGLPLRWTDEEDGQWVERRDVCVLNAEQGLDPLSLEAEACWTLGPAEAKLRDLQLAHEPACDERLELQRISLRDLFRRTG